MGAELLSSGVSQQSPRPLHVAALKGPSGLPMGAACTAQEAHVQVHAGFPGAEEVTLRRVTTLALCT